VPDGLESTKSPQVAALPKVPDDVRALDM